MKTYLNRLVTVGAIFGAVALMQFQAGCAATGTRQSTGEYLDDAAITARVKAAFVRDPIVKALDVSVDTFKGVVQLGGFVDSREQREQAERVAAAIGGVTEVRNNLVLKTATTAR